MGTTTSKLPEKHFQSTKKEPALCCCLRACQKSTYTYSSSSISIDERYLPTFDRLSSNRIHLYNDLVIVNVPSTATNLSTCQRSQRFFAKKNRSTHFPSFDQLEKSLHDTTSIDQWIDSLPKLATPDLTRTHVESIVDEKIDTTNVHRVPVRQRNLSIRLVE
jgi:hypothetical protein